MSLYIQFARKIFAQLSKGLNAANPIHSEFVYRKSEILPLVTAFLANVMTEKDIMKIDASHHQFDVKPPAHPKHRVYNFLKEIIFNDENLNNLVLMQQKFKEAETLFKLQLETWLPTPITPKHVEVRSAPVSEIKETKRVSTDSDSKRAPATNTFPIVSQPSSIEGQLQNLIHELLVRGSIHPNSPAAVEDLGNLLIPFTSLPLIHVLPTVQFYYDKKSCQILNRHLNEMLLDNKKILLGITHNGCSHYVMFEIRFLPKQKYQLCIIDSVGNPTQRIEYNESLSIFLKKFNIPYDLVENTVKIDFTKLLQALSITHTAALDCISNPHKGREWLEKFSLTSDEALQFMRLLKQLAMAIANEVLLQNIRSAICIEGYTEDRSLSCIIYTNEQPIHNNDCLFYAARNVMGMLVNIPKCVIDEEVMLAIKNPNIKDFKLHVLKETVRALQHSSDDGVRRSAQRIDMTNMRYDENGAICLRASPTLPELSLFSGSSSSRDALPVEGQAHAIDRTAISRRA